MNTLTVLYDPGCPLCQWVAGWLSGQSQLVELRFVAAGSADAQVLFPDLDHQSTLENITVVSDDGDVFRNENAWVMCLWALKSYRRAAIRFSRPRFMPMTKRFVAAVSKYRPSDAHSSVCEGSTCDGV